jgi:CheY-like chemotaxis protein
MAPRRVLLIDDEDDIREIAQLSLEMVAHWDVVTASSGAEGLERAAQEQPDAILLDVMMPDLDGVATLGRLQADPVTSHIPVIFLTAKVQADLAELGAVSVIPKPFDPMRLSSQVASSLGWAD